MSYVVYKLIHFFGIVTIVSALAARSMHTISGGSSAISQPGRWLAIAHGIGMVLVLIGGFGMLARIGVLHDGLPGWVHLKLLVWVLAGAALAAASRRADLAPAVLLALPLLVTFAAAIALYKP